MLAVLMLAFTATACGDDDGDSSASSGDTGQTDDGGGDASGGTQGECAGTAITGSSPNGAFTAAHASGVELAGGKAATVYLTDFELSVDDLSFFSLPEVPAGGTLATLAITVFNAPDEDALEPLEAGQVIEYSDEWEVLTFVVTVTDDGGTHGLSSDAEGTVTLTAVGDTLCGSVEYSDTEKSISGTFEAPLRRA